MLWDSGVRSRVYHTHNPLKELHGEIQYNNFKNKDELKYCCDPLTFDFWIFSFSTSIGLLWSAWITCFGWQPEKELEGKQDNGIIVNWIYCTLFDRKYILVAAVSPQWWQKMTAYNIMTPIRRCCGSVRYISSTEVRHGGDRNELSSIN